MLTSFRRWSGANHADGDRPVFIVDDLVIAGNGEQRRIRLGSVDVGELRLQFSRPGIVVLGHHCRFLTAW